MVLSMGYEVPTTTTSQSGLQVHSEFDYTAVVGSHGDAAFFLTFPDPDLLKIYMLSGLFVMQANRRHPSKQVFQAVCKMYMCAKFLQKKVLRGVLTNGRDWMFLLVKLDDNYDKAIFKQSFMMELTFKKSVDGTRETTGPWPDLIAGVLSYWIENSFVDLESDDWFEPHQAIDLSPRRAWS